MALSRTSLALWWRTIRPLALGAVTLIALPWTAFWYLGSYLIMDRWSYLDFGRFYYAVRLWRDGMSLYGPSMATWLQLETEGVHLWNLNPPHVSLIFWPLSYLTLEWAFLAWCVVTAASLGWSAWIIVRTLEIRLPAQQWLLWTLFVLAAAPTLSFVSTGNITGPITLLMTLVWRSWRAGRWTSAAIGIGIAWSAKLFLLPLVAYLVLTRRWRPALIASGTGAAWLLLGGAVFGWSELARWISLAREVQWPWLPINASMMAPMTRAAYVAADWTMDAPHMAIAVRVGTVLGLVVAGIGTWRAVRDPDRDRAYLLLLLTAILASPLGWIYYWWMFAAPLIACGRTSTTVRYAWWLSLPGWLMPMWFVWPYLSVDHALTLGSIYFWSLLALWIGTMRASWCSQSLAVRKPVSQAA